jgi:hypothetical protein
MAARCGAAGGESKNKTAAGSFHRAAVLNSPVHPADVL